MMKWLPVKCLLWFLLLCTACKEQGELKQILLLSGENRKELEVALRHYEGDSLKQRAVCFLIQNMPGNGTIAYTFVDNNNIACPLEDLLALSVDSLYKRIQSGSFRQEQPVPDLLSISSGYLIENIDLAFEVWKSYPWCKQLSFDEFCRYILPYRLKQEPLGRWRAYYYHRYKPVADSLVQAGATMKDVVVYFNSHYGKKYIQDATKIPGDFPFSLIEHLGGGTCDHLALNAVQLFRAIGVPMNLDLLPYHGKVNGGHAYNSFINEAGQFYFFSPYEREPERAGWIAPLVQRVSYEWQPEPNVEVNKWNSLIVNRHLKNVTDEYYKTTAVSFPAEMMDTLQYLATYNRGSFRVVAQTRVENNSAKYPTLSCGLLYFPMVGGEQELLSAGNPFIVSDNGDVDLLCVNRKDVLVNGVKLYDAKRILTLGNEKYTLCYWDKGWQPVKTVVSKDSETLDFGIVPLNSLFLVYGDTFMGRMQRPFAVKEGECIYY